MGGTRAILGPSSVFTSHNDLASDKEVRFSSTTDPLGTKDLTIKRVSAATLGLTDGAGGVAKLNAVSGGTGQTAYVAGDLLYASSTTALSRLAVGSNTQVLTLAAGLPSWAAPAGGTLAATLATGNTTGGTSLVVSAGDVIRGVDAATGTALALRGGNGSAGVGGLASFTGGAGVGTNQAAGGVTLDAGNSSGTGSGLLKFAAPTASGSGAGTNTSANVTVMGSSGFEFRAAAGLYWSSTSDPTAAGDTGIVRSAAGILMASNGSGNIGSSWLATAISLGSALTSSQAGAAGQFRSYTAGNVLQATLSSSCSLGPTGQFFWGGTDAGSGDTAMARISAGVMAINNAADANAYFVIGNSVGLKLRTGDQHCWSNSATNANNTADTGLARDAAGVVRVSNGSTGYGTLSAPTIVPTAITGTNQAGTAQTESGGLGTGTGVPGLWKVQTGIVGTTGSTAHVAADRIYVGTKTLSLTDNTIATFATISVASGAMCGGVVFFTVRASDATDHQGMSGQFSFAAVNKAGTMTVGNSALSVATGAYSGGSNNTVSIATSAGTNAINLRVTSDTTLAPTTLDITYTIILNSPGLVTPA